MGMFKNLKQGIDIMRSDDLKEIKKKADAMPKTNPLDSLKQANQAMDMAAQYQQGGIPGMGDPALFSTGLAGNATIKSLRDTGTFINNAPVVEMQLSVSLPDREPYDVTHSQVLAHTAIPSFQPGMVQPVRVDPNDPGRLAIG